MGNAAGDGVPEGVTTARQVIDSRPCRRFSAAVQSHSAASSFATHALGQQLITILLAYAHTKRPAQRCRPVNERPEKGRESGLPLPLLLSGRLRPVLTSFAGKSTGSGPPKPRARATS